MIIFIDRQKYKYLNDEEKKALESTHVKGGRTIDSVIGAYHSDTDRFDRENEVTIEGVTYGIHSYKTNYRKRPLGNGSLEKVVQVFLIK